MRKKMKFLCIFLVFGQISGYAQFNTVLSREKKSESIVVVKPLHGESLYNREKVGEDSIVAVEEGEMEAYNNKKGVEEVAVSVEPVAKGKAVGVDESLFDFFHLLALPLDSIKFTSRFGDRVHPIERIRMPHNGVDLVADSSWVYSVMPGKVKRVGSDKRSGNYVVIEHGNYQSIYCHLRKSYVRRNEIVDAGQIVGLSGDTGLCTGEHLHFSLKYEGKYVDPEPFLNFIQGMFMYMGVYLGVD